MFQDNSPAWLISAIAAMRLKYPDDAFETDNGFMKCLDCEGRKFKPSWNNAINNFETHLKGKAHRSNVTHRLEKFKDQESFFQSKMIGLDFNIPQQPTMVFAHKGQQNLSAFRNQYLAALENDATSKEIRLTFLESRIAELAKRNNDHLEQVDATLEAAERKTTGELDCIKEQFRDQVNSSEERTKDELKCMGEKVKSSDEKCTSGLDGMTSRLARSDHRNIDQIETIGERLDESDKRSQKRSNELGQKIKDLESKNARKDGWIIDLELQLQVHTEELQRHTDELQRQQESEEAFRKAISDQMEAHLQQTDKRMKAIEKASEERFLGLELQSEERIKALEKKNAAQQEEIDKLKGVIPIIFEDAQELREFVQQSFESDRETLVDDDDETEVEIKS